ncbi:MAG: AIPR family protein [Chloroflexota bacterium]|nr:AIPR family protein [Chloroflexota bacterium]MDQ5866618.1 AIPR family protein [Chloroflexota bacterium]
MSSSLYRFNVKYARRMPDPTFPGADRHIFICAVQDIPPNLPEGANPREQDIDRRIYKQVAEHLLNKDGTPNTFHLKNKGLTILAESVNRIRDDLYDVTFVTPVQGVVDGLHTNEIIHRHRDEILASQTSDNPIRQFVKVEVLTGVDDSFVTEIAGGLNTAVQVQKMSLLNLAERFTWIKDELSGEPYATRIAYTENAEGLYDVRDILVLLDLFNIFDFPNDGSSSPVRAYTSKENVLRIYEANQGKFEKLRPILKDILVLHDVISSTARDRYNEGGGRKGGLLKFVEQAKRKPFEFPFIGTTGDWRLYRGALFPMLSAFRRMLEVDVTGTVRWRGGFTEVLDLWDHIGKELMEATQLTSEELGRNPMAIGKSQNHWARLHDIVLKRGFMKMM